MSALADPPTEAELRHAAADGPVATLNVAMLRSDAMILTQDGVAVLPLSGVGPSEVAEKADDFLSALSVIHDHGESGESQADAEEALAEVLGWLSDRITGPVLDHLGYAAGPSHSSPWPRVWWCPAGYLSLLPLHAAGHHKPTAGPGDAAIDRVICSTTPTLRALMHARRNVAAASNPRILVVTMPHTPGQHDLLGAARDRTS